MNWARVWTPLNLQRLLFADLFTHVNVGGRLRTLGIAVSAILGATVLGAIVGVMRASSNRALV